MSDDVELVMDKCGRVISVAEMRAHDRMVPSSGKINSDFPFSTKSIAIPVGLGHEGSYQGLGSLWHY